MNEESLPWSTASMLHLGSYTRTPPSGAGLSVFPAGEAPDMAHSWPMRWGSRAKHLPPVNTCDREPHLCSSRTGVCGSIRTGSGRWTTSESFSVWMVSLRASGCLYAIKQKNIYQIRRRNIEFVYLHFTCQFTLTVPTQIHCTNGHYRKINLDRALSAFFMTRHTLL